MAQTEGVSTELVAGRYRVLRELARGGVGAVYEAVDESSGRKVALKRLHGNGAENPRLVLLFEAEFDTLARLKHPHIVEVFDYGIDKRGPYFTMELLDGQDLSELEPIPYRDACRYLRDVASSLALLHTRRRLHRDLSPRNVRVTSDGRCRLLDFGTMANFGVSDDIVGTPPLVPPEALRCTALDHRADLYSLGALAYRILSGRYPYRARQLEDLPELWRTPPMRLREVAPEVPPVLEDLVMSMLSLDSAYRPNTTYEVIDRLTAIAGLPPDEYKSRTAQGYLVGSRLIGRARQMDVIQRRIARARREHGATVVIEGNPGVGKSRLLDEAALHAQLSGALSIRIDARAHPGHYGAIRALIRAICEAAPHDAREAATPYRAGLAQLSNAFGTAKHSSAQLHSAALRTQIHNAVLHWLFDLAEDRTLVMLVDDLPRLDEASAALLNHLSQSVSSHRVLLIVTRRLADHVPVSASADALVTRARRLRVHRFNRTDTQLLLQSLFGNAPNVELLSEWMHGVTTGSPMQIMELARHLVREQIVRFVDGMWVLPPHVPQTSLQRNLAAILNARAAALPQAQRDLAEALSVRRGTMSLGLCRELSDDNDSRQVYRALDELVAKGVLLSRGDLYQFGQEALREVFLRRLPVGRAQQLYRRLGDALLAEGSKQPVDLIEAGYNLIRGGDEMRGADIIADAAMKLPVRGPTTSAALPAIEAALEVYEHWGRSPKERLDLLTVLTGALDRRATQLHADVTLHALCSAAGGQGNSGSIARGRLGFWLGFATARGFHWLTPQHQRGPSPVAALRAFYRVAFSTLSVRGALLDLDGALPVVAMAQQLRYAGPMPALIADTFLTQQVELRGDIAQARHLANTLLARVAARPTWLQSESPALVQAVVATLQIGLGILEARHALQSGKAIECVEALKSVSTQARPHEDDEDPTDFVEFQLAAAELEHALQLARGHRVRVDASARGSSLISMQLQFEVWHTVIDCDVSMRTLDFASLRRTVETFTHYVAEQPGLVVWLEIARAHLALCLGKPQEALATYNKWLDQLQPGKHLAWDTLFFGRAEALLSSGGVVAARDWLEQALTHPVVRSGADSAVCVTLEAQLARAEAESQAVAAATARIQALLQRLKDSDHALAQGFVHEVAARVAHRAGDETRRAEHLTQMKNWYTVTRNQAAMMRGQKVHHSLETRSSRVPPEAEVDRNVVTKVTTRRESSCE